MDNPGILDRAAIISRKSEFGYEKYAPKHTETTHYYNKLFLRNIFLSCLQDPVRPFPVWIVNDVRDLKCVHWLRKQMQGNRSCIMIIFVCLLFGSERIEKAKKSLQEQQTFYWHQMSIIFCKKEIKKKKRYME